MSNPKVFLDMTIGGQVSVGTAIGGQPAVRVRMEAYVEVVPRTRENFRALPTGKKGAGRSGKPPHDKGSTVHPVIPGFMCQGGVITAGNSTGGKSIYGSKVTDANFIKKHTDPGGRPMAKASRGTNGSQFIPTPKTKRPEGQTRRRGDGRDQGRLESGPSSSRRTSKPVVIAFCGQLS